MPLTNATYGKDNVKFLKVKKDPLDPVKQEVLEANVCLLLKGDIEAAWTKADNGPIVPTDTVKNTILVEAKTQDVWPIEKFAAHLAQHFIKKYSHISEVSIFIKQQKWTKYAVNGKIHPHSFKHEGPETRNCSLEYNRNGSYTLKSGIKDLTVLKSTGSMFYGYNVCDYTTLKPTTDRILSTDVDSVWQFDSKKLGPISNIAKLADTGLFDSTYDAARKVTMDLFALEQSASVQATMYNMSEKILSLVPEVEFVTYELPNKHYLLFNLEWKGITSNDELFYPSPDPNGLIKSTVGRSKSKL